MASLLASHVKRLCIQDFLKHGKASKSGRLFSSFNYITTGRGGYYTQANARRNSSASTQARKARRLFAATWPDGRSFAAMRSLAGRGVENHTIMVGVSSWSREDCICNYRKRQHRGNQKIDKEVRTWLIEKEQQPIQPASLQGHVFRFLARCRCFGARAWAAMHKYPRLVVHDLSFTY